MTDTGASGDWTARDSVLFASCEILVAATTGRLDERPVLAHSFALQFAHDERLLATGSYQLHWWGASGDGTYEKRTTIVGGTGIIGMGLLGATAIGSAVGNANRRSRAAAEAMAQWRPVDGGYLHISNEGFYLQGSAGFRSFSWRHVVEGDLTAETRFAFNAMTTNGTDHFCLTSDWSELVFMLWALAVNRNHPRLVNNTWVNPTFFQKCERYGYPTPRPSLGPG